jgi:hypothetical protein
MKWKYDYTLEFSPQSEKPWQHCFNEVRYAWQQGIRSVWQHCFEVTSISSVGKLRSVWQHCFEVTSISSVGKIRSAWQHCFEVRSVSSERDYIPRGFSSVSVCVWPAPLYFSPFVSVFPLTGLT